MIDRKYLSRLLATAALLLTPAAIAQDQAPAATAATPAPAVAETVDADPALWVVRDADTTIYLFGTVHVLRPGLSWFDEGIRAAFDASDELKIEVVLPDDPTALAPAFAAAGSYPAGTTLTSRLTEAQRTTYTGALAGLNIPAAALDPYEPWFASLQLSMGIYAAMGFAPGAGAESVLTQAAAAAGKPISGFETAEEQIGFLDSTPESEQIGGLINLLTKAREIPDTINRLMASWTDGSPEGTAAVMNEAMTEAPETVRIMLTDRNRRWAQSLRERMDRPGTVFVAVGAGHLAGEGSVQQFLTEGGLTVERVAY